MTFLVAVYLIVSVCLILSIPRRLPWEDTKAHLVVATFWLPVLMVVACAVVSAKKEKARRGC